MSIQNIQIDGLGHFIETAENAGVVAQGIFDDTSINSGLVSTTATFQGNAVNSGSVIESAEFSGNTVNTGQVTVAVFADAASNAGVVTQQATFVGTASNTGVVSGAAVFEDSAENNGGSVQGPALFTGNAVNTGTVTQAVFIGSAQNAGTVTMSAVFADAASNSGTIQGDAVFADSTTNSGTVQGDAQVAATATNSGTVEGTTQSYSQPDGFFVNGYYSGGTKTAPAAYATVVHQVGGFWYKYDASGNAALATGSFDDGSTDTYAFAGGVKGVLTGQGGGNAYYAELSGVWHYYDNGVDQGPISGSHDVDGNGSLFYSNGTLHDGEGDSFLHWYINGVDVGTFDVYYAMTLFTGVGADNKYYVNGALLSNTIVEATIDENGNEQAISFDTLDEVFYQDGVPYSGEMWANAIAIFRDRDEYGIEIGTHHGLVSVAVPFLTGKLHGNVFGVGLYTDAYSQQYSILNTYTNGIVDVYGGRLGALGTFTVPGLGTHEFSDFGNSLYGQVVLG